MLWLKCCVCYYVILCLQLANVEMLEHETDNTQHLELLTEHISTLQLENSRLKGRVEVMLACVIYYNTILVQLW